MNNDVYIFEVSEHNFGQVVQLNSYKLPVLVEFMGVWSGPCVQMADTLSMLAKEFSGQFIFAKVDTDEQSGLMEAQGIENVPTLKMFKDGEVVRTEEGQLQEVELRALLRDYGIFRESDEMRQQAREKHMAGDTSAAVVLLSQAQQKDPANTRIAMDMVQIFIDVGQLEDAKGLFGKLPKQEQESEMGKALSGQLLFVELAAATEGAEALQMRLQQDASDHAARFDFSICQVAAHQYRQAIDNLFLILQQEPDFKQGAAREMIVTLLNMLSSTEPDLAQEYRRQLGNLLAE